MATIRLGFKAFDAHELLCHFVAEKAGLYKRTNVEIELVDLTFSNDADMPDSLCQASCGAALSSILKGNPQRVMFVATDRPMFWLYSQPGILDLAALDEKRISTFPPIAPPHHLANIILRKAGVDTGNVALLAARDDVARLGLLRSGNVDAAVISSAVSPLKIEQDGFNTLAFFGDHLRIPTTGFAVHQTYLEKQAALIEGLVNVFKKAVRLIRDDPRMVAIVLREVFDVPADIAGPTAVRFQPYYTENGQTTTQIAQTAIESLSKTMGLNSAPNCETIYLGGFADD
tara:strand:+ start:63 stop:923 length:861 start_codon:yes stop_codon:yes gene_type:complete